MGTPINIGRGSGDLIGSAAIFSVIGHPTDETDQMIYEIGAMISDLQRMGDLAVEHWKR
jgi:hypothetical protein